VPLGLIANELIGNAFEHAFPEGRRGTVAVKVSYQRRDGQNEPSARAQLEIGDDGVGLPAGFRLEAQDSLGFDLIRILTRQLRGEVAVRRAASGARFELSFPLTEE
jgi:two-component sensor histidine kinase